MLAVFDTDNISTDHHQWLSVQKQNVNIARDLIVMQQHEPRINMENHSIVSLSIIKSEALYFSLRRSSWSLAAPGKHDYVNTRILKGSHNLRISQRKNIRVRAIMFMTESI